MIVFQEDDPLGFSRSEHCVCFEAVSQELNRKKHNLLIRRCCTMAKRQAVTMNELRAANNVAYRPSPASTASDPKTERLSDPN